MTRQEEDQQREEAKAVRMSRNGTMSVTEFLVFYNDEDLRTRVMMAARVCQDNVDTAEDLCQDVWAEVCQLPSKSSREDVLRAAKRVLHKFENRHWRRRKKVNIMLDSTL